MIQTSCVAVSRLARPLHCFTARGFFHVVSNERETGSKIRRILSEKKMTLDQLKPRFPEGNAKKRPHEAKNAKVQKKAKLGGNTPRFEGTNEEVLSRDLSNLRSTLDPELLEAAKEKGRIERARFSELEVEIHSISSTGDGLGFAEDGSTDIFIVPFTTVGDRARIKAIRETSSPEGNHWYCDNLKIIKPGHARQDDLIRCRYFATCAGCQFQMLPYDRQLAHKKTVIERAYENFSALPASRVPKVRETMASPLQYLYRTKLTPHFDGPPGARRGGRNKEKAHFKEVPPIGFMKKGMRQTLDIEECPIATEAVQLGLTRERSYFKENIEQYSSGRTILLRESTRRTSTADDEGKAFTDAKQTEDFVDEKICVTENKAITTEYVGDFVFKNVANSFFQNNNSILPSFTAYVRDNAIHDSAENPVGDKDGKMKNLIDAYCGSGLFTVTLSSLFERSIGIDIDGEGIAYAWENARLNGLPIQEIPEKYRLSSSSAQSTTKSSDTGGGEPQSGQVSFMAATASSIFGNIPSSFDPAETVVVIDPPRKGCDEDFLTQLLKFAPERIVYVSCNVHTQARDVGWLLNNASASPAVYEIESLRGFDFFPQTSHVESVAILRRTRAEAS